MILTTGTILNSEQAKKILIVYGNIGASFDGSLPEDCDASDIEFSDKFEVLINYGNEVQLNKICDDGTISGDGRVRITLKNLFGRCDSVSENGVLSEAKWHAVADI